MQLRLQVKEQSVCLRSCNTRLSCNAKMYPSFSLVEYMVQQQCTSLPMSSRMLACTATQMYLSWEASHSMKPASCVCTPSASADTTGGPFEFEGTSPFSCTPSSRTALLGRVRMMAVSSLQAFSWVNQSVRCSSLQLQMHVVSHYIKVTEGPEQSGGST